MTDHYKTLGISPDADEREIRAAYRRMARKYHPDAGEGSSAERFHAIQDAYDLLTDSEKRRQYDQNRHDADSRFAPYIRQAPERTVHLDLRHIMQPSGRRRSEPLEFRSTLRMLDVDERWDELLRLFFRGL